MENFKRYCLGSVRLVFWMPISSLHCLIRDEQASPFHLLKSRIWMIEWTTERMIEWMNEWQRNKYSVENFTRYCFSPVKPSISKTGYWMPISSLHCLTRDEQASPFHLLRDTDFPRSRKMDGIHGIDHLKRKMQFRTENRGKPLLPQNFSFFKKKIVKLNTIFVTRYAVKKYWASNHG